MPEDDIFRIPYRIQTPEDVILANRSNFPGINKHYGTLLELAQTTSLVQPPALQGARVSAGGVFHLFREEKKRVCDVSFEEVAGIQLIEDFKEIERMLPFDRFTPDQLTVVGCFNQLPPEIMKAIVPQSQQAPVTDIGAVLAIKKLLRREIRSYVATKTFHAVSPAQFRHLCAIYTLHQLDNEDIQHVLLNPLESRTRSPFFQQAVCDLLFVRIPRELNQITRVEPQFIKRRLFSRIERLGLTNRQKINLFGYFKPGIRLDELEPLLNRIDAVAAKILTPSTWQQLHSYINSLQTTIAGIASFYKDIFLSRQLDLLRRLHKPGPHVRKRFSFRDIVLNSCTIEKHLQFYPVKDYLDLCKNGISKDCTDPEGLGREQLLSPFFFNMRIFDDERWIGNVYMLDFTQPHGVLIVDRIQLPRAYKAEYLDFFTVFRQVLEELFIRVNYTSILLPARISNHAAIQTAHNTFKKKLPRKELHITSPHAVHFESVHEKHRFYVLASKD